MGRSGEEEKEEGLRTGADRGGGQEEKKDGGVFGTGWSLEACCMPECEFPESGNWDATGNAGKEAAAPKKQKADATTP